MNKAIFLDRDGVINQLVVKDGVGRAPYTLEDFKLFEGVEEAANMLIKAGFLLIVVTNQPDVKRGWVSEESVHLINKKVKDLLPITDIKICFHVGADKCVCRKPEPGMLLEGAKDHNIDMSKSFMIGDRYSDMAAGARAGTKTVLVGPGDKQENFPSPNYHVLNLLEAAKIILKEI